MLANWWWWGGGGLEYIMDGVDFVPYPILQSTICWKEAQEYGLQLGAKAYDSIIGRSWIGSE